MGMKPRVIAKKVVRRPADLAYADPELFLPLTEGERADALRLMTEEKKLSTMAKVGRYRVVAVEPLVLKPPHERAGHRCARVVVYDYASDARVESSVDLSESKVFFASSSKAQPMLAPAEEAEAVRIASASGEVRERLTMGEQALGVMHYWSRTPADLAFRRRSAAVLFGVPGNPASLVAVVDLVDGIVLEVVSADRW